MDVAWVVRGPATQELLQGPCTAGPPSPPIHPSGVEIACREVDSRSDVRRDTGDVGEVGLLEEGVNA